MNPGFAGAIGVICPLNFGRGPMKKTNSLFTVTCVVLAAAAGGSGFALYFGETVRAATTPVMASLRELADGQKKMEATLITAGKNTSAALETRIASLESEVKTLKDQLALQAGPPPEDMNKVYDIPVADSYVLGPKDAPLTITVFQDYQCPFCGRFYPTALDGQKAFPDKVRIVVKHFPLPFHDKARPAAKAAMAAGEQGKFYEMTDLILANSENLSDDKFKELAQKTGLDVNKFLKDLKDKDAVYEKRIEDDMELAGKADVRGTPTFFLNGKKSAARTAEAWKDEILSALKK
jgi:protein-disulfide isomerase